MELEKITKRRGSEEKRRYEDACGLAHAMELLGERWAMLVLRELAYGPRRFSELKADLTGISANVLAQRLTELEERKLVRKTKLAPPASIQVYEATNWGLEVVPLIASLGRWAARSPWHNPALRMSHVSVVMSFQTLISPERAAGLRARIGFHFGEVTYVLAIHDGRIDVHRGPVEDCDVEFTGTPSEIAAVVHGGAPLEKIEVKGDMDLAKRFRTLFPLPPKIG
jgi:DNA-binding HxlR family transcriptional regulator